MVKRILYVYNNGSQKDNGFESFLKLRHYEYNLVKSEGRAIQKINSGKYTEVVVDYSNFDESLPILDAARERGLPSIVFSDEDNLESTKELATVVISRASKRKGIDYIEAIKEILERKDLKR